MRTRFLSLLLLLFLSQLINAQSFNPSLFCFEDAFLLSKNYTFEDQVKLLKNLGYDGIELEGLDNYEEKLKILDKYDLKVFMVYIQIDLEKEQPYDSRLHDFIKMVKGKGVTLWLHIHSEKYGPSDPSGDAACIPILQNLADFARKYNVNLALYPHSRFWLEKVGDSVRLTQKADRDNLGAVFNLCHFLKTDTRDSLELKLIKSIPFLSAVSINGADDGNTLDMEWTRLIQPLGEGSFDVLNILRLLKTNDYKGPIGLQCYDIKGDPAVFLKTSITTWERYLKEMQ
jgi:sugar phosphate isomerase/epimerase